MANKKRLIDADALLELVQFRLPIDNQNAEVIAGCVDITRRTIEAQPTIDAVEVVRCKDCRAYLPPTKSRDWGICRRHSTPMRDDNFCNYGERKEE